MTSRERWAAWEEGRASNNAGVNTLRHDDHAAIRSIKDEVAASFPAGSRRDEAIQALAPSKHDSVKVIKDAAGKVVGVGSVWTSADSAQEEGVPDGPMVRVRNMATVGANNGRELFKAMVGHAKSKQAGIYLSSLEKSRGFYEALGMHQAGGATYYLTADEVSSIAAHANGGV